MYKVKGIDELFKLYPFCDAYGECPYLDMNIENKCLIMCEHDFTSEDALSYADTDIDELIDEGLV